MKKWYVVYVKSRAEKKVLQSLDGNNIEAWLPLRGELRKWSDRKKLVEMPLLPGYVFVRVNRKDYDRVLATDNVVCYITFGGKAVPVRNEDIVYLKQILRQDQVLVELTREDLKPGELVEVLAGPLAGVRGELVECRGKHRVGIRIRQINYTVMVEVPVSGMAIIKNEPVAKKAIA